MVVPTCHKNGVLWKPFRDSAWSVILFWQLYTHTRRHTWYTEISALGAGLQSPPTLGQTAGKALSQTGGFWGVHTS